MINDLWPENLIDATFEENNSIEILREQAKAISKKTNNYINATFSKINYAKSEYESALFKMAESFAKATPNSLTREEELEPELDKKINMNELYKKILYKFEIYNSTYRFRIFVLEYSIEFPIYFTLDEGIREELHYDNRAEVHSNQELEELLRKIFSSHKIKVIISRMLQVVEADVIQKKITEYIEEFSNATISDISVYLGMTKDTTKKHLNRMRELGILEKVGTGRNIKWIVVKGDEK